MASLPGASQNQVSVVQDWKDRCETRRSMPAAPPQDGRYTALFQQRHILANLPLLDAAGGS